MTKGELHTRVLMRVRELAGWDDAEIRLVRKHAGRKAATFTRSGFEIHGGAFLIDCDWLPKEIIEFPNWELGEEIRNTRRLYPLI